MACSTLTFAGSCNPILYEGAIPIFIDSDYVSWNIDPNLVAEFLKKRARVNKLPKALIVVHLFGQSADLDPILEVCGRHEVAVIEDAAEALGTLYKGKPVGTLADAADSSFNGNKIITCTGGGMFVSTRKEHADKVRFWSTQARDPGVNYLHSELGYNYRMSNVLASTSCAGSWKPSTNASPYAAPLPSNTATASQTFRAFISCPRRTTV